MPVQCKERLRSYAGEPSSSVDQLAKAGETPGDRRGGRFGLFVAFASAGGHDGLSH